MNSSKPLAFITGASSGLGKALAMTLAEKGWNLFLTGRSQPALSSISSYLRPRCEVRFRQVNLANRDQRKKLTDFLKEEAPELVINCAGFGIYGDLLHSSIEQQTKIVEVNSTAVMELTIQAAKSLIAQKKEGIILNVSSIAGFFSFPLQSTYAASKSFVTQFSLSFDAEIKEKGVRILVSCPGQIDTNFSYRAGKNKKIPKSSRAMAKEYAAERIFTQIQKKKSIDIFDFRFKSYLWLSKLTPRSLSSSVIQKEISKLYPVEAAREE